MIPRTLARNGWRRHHLTGAIGIVGLGVWSTYSTFEHLWRTSVAHGEALHLFLLPLVLFWLVWVRRQRFRMCKPGGNWVGPPLVLLGWMMMFGHRYDIVPMAHFGAILLVLGCIFSVLGHGLLKHFLPAVVLLVFLVPAPWVTFERFAEPIDEFTSGLMRSIYDLAGMEASRHHEVFVVNGLEVPVKLSCDGLCFICTGVVAYAFAYGAPLREFVRLLILAASPFVAVSCHLVRVLFTGWVYEVWPTVGHATLHLMGSLVMLPLLFVILVGILSLLNWASVPVRRYRLAYDS